MLARGVADIASDTAPLPNAYNKKRGKILAGKGGAQGYYTRKELLVESKAARQPLGVRDGLERALDSVTREVNSTIETVICVPIRLYNQTGPGGFVTNVVRALPVAVLRPVAGAAEALSYTLLGLRNSLDPDARRDEEDLWDVDITSSSSSSYTT